MSNSKDEAAANRELALRFMRLVQDGEVEQAAECLAEDYVQVFPRPGIPGLPAGIEGRAQFVEFVSLLPVYEPGSIRMQMENVIAAGPMVVVQFKMNATTSRGEPYENFYVQIIECHGGKITKSWEYCDNHYAMKMLVPELI